MKEIPSSWKSSIKLINPQSDSLGKTKKTQISNIKNAETSLWMLQILKR